MKTCTTVLCLLFLATTAMADQITMKNGDRLSGSITKSDGKELVIKTDYAGDVTVKFGEIQAIASAGDLNVITGGGKIVTGTVSTSNDNLVVATKDAGPVSVPITAVTTVRSPSEQAAYEKSQHPGLLEGWAGGLNLGLAVTRGNSETKNLSLAFNAVRTGARDKVILYLNSIYATNDALAATPSTTANSIASGARYDHDLTPRVFAFVAADYYHDELQSLDLRSIYGGGLGVHVIKGDTTTLDVLAGANYTHESYSQAFDPTFSPATTRNLAALTLGDEFMHKLGKNTVITQNLYFYPDLSDTGEYRGTGSFGTVTKLKKWLGWQTSFADIYSSAPPIGKKKNDLLLSTGLNFSFMH